MKRIRDIEKAMMKEKVADFHIGDTVRVHVKIIEGDKTRIQDFQGTVIARKGSGARETFTVRKISFGEGVERIFPIHSPVVHGIEVMRSGKVRRAKLYYLRDRTGKQGKLEERTTDKEKSAAAEVRTEAESA